MALRFLPNVITIARIFLIIPVVWTLLSEQFAVTLVLFFVAGISDGVDGFLARRFNWSSYVGSFLDPLADKLLLVSCCVCLTWMNLFPQWLLLLIIVRDVIVFSGAIAYRYFIGTFFGRPSYLSKLSTAAEIVFILVIVWELAYFPIAPWLQPWLIITVAVLSTVSGLHYVWYWTRKAMRREVDVV